MTDIASLGLEIRSDGVVKATDRLDRFERQAGKTERGTKMLVGALSRLATVAGAALAAAFSTRAIFDFQDAIAEVSTLVDTSKFSMDALSTAALNQGRAFGNVQGQVAAYYQIISAGASTVEQATATLDAANKLAVGGVTTTAIAADGLTSVLNAYGDKVKDATAVSDALFIGMRAGKTTIAELSAGLGKVAPLAAQTGVSFDELVGSVSALTKGGIATQEAITGVRAILAAVAKPTSEAVKLSKALGFEFNSTALASKGLEGFLADLVAKTGGNTDALAQLFAGVEALVPVMALSGQAGADFTAIMEQMADKAGATEEAFAKMAASPGFQAKRLFGTITAEVIEMSGAIANMAVPALTFLADKAVYLSDIMGRLVAIAGVMGAYMAVGWVSAFMAGTTAVGALTAGLTLLRGALIRTGVGALVVLAGELVYQLYNVVDGARDIGDAFDRLKRSGVETWERITDGGTAMYHSMEYWALEIASMYLMTWTKIQNGFFDMLRQLQGATGVALPGMVEWEDSIIRSFGQAAELHTAALGAQANATAALAAMTGDKSSITRDLGGMPSFSELGSRLGGTASGTGGSGGGGGTIPGGGGGGSGGTYADLIKGAREFIATQQLEAQALGMTEEAANKLRYTQDLLNQAANDNIRLSPAQRNELGLLAGAMAATEAATKKAKEAFDFAKDAAKGFLTDMRQSLMNGASLWESFGSAALNVLDKVISKIEDQLIDALFSMGSAMGGGGKGGGFNIFSAIGSLFGFAGGGYTGPGATNQVAGVVHGGEYVFSAAATNRMGVANLDAMHSAAKGYAGGGYVGAVPDFARNGQGQNSNTRITVDVGVSVDDEGKLQAYVKSVSQKEAQTAAGTAAQVAISQSAKQTPGIMAKYNQSRAGSDYRT